MQDEAKREYYWLVQAIDNGKIIFNKEYHDKDGKAFRVYKSLKSKGAVSIQRKWYERKIA